MEGYVEFHYERFKIYKNGKFIPCYRIINIIYPNGTFEVYNEQTRKTNLNKLENHIGYPIKVFENENYLGHWTLTEDYIDYILNMN